MRQEGSGLHLHARRSQGFGTGVFLFHINRADHCDTMNY